MSVTSADGKLGWPNSISRGFFSWFLWHHLLSCFLFTVIYSFTSGRIGKEVKLPSRLNWETRLAKRRTLYSLDTTGNSSFQVFTFSEETSRLSLRVNLPHGRDGQYLIRAKEKVTNLYLTVVIIFTITNLPHMVDLFIRQEILADAWCTRPWCGAVEV